MPLADCMKRKAVTKPKESAAKKPRVEIKECVLFNDDDDEKRVLEQVQKNSADKMNVHELVVLTERPAAAAGIEKPRLGRALRTVSFAPLPSEDAKENTGDGGGARRKTFAATPADKKVVKKTRPVLDAQRNPAVEVTKQRRSLAIQPAAQKVPTNAARRISERLPNVQAPERMIIPRTTTVTKATTTSTTAPKRKVIVAKKPSKASEDAAGKEIRTDRITTRETEAVDQKLPDVVPVTGCVNKSNEPLRDGPERTLVPPAASEEPRKTHPHFYPDYAPEIMSYTLSLESRYAIPVDFIATSTFITHANRELLVDWLIQVQVHQDLSNFTLQLCVCLIDQYLTRKPIVLDKLQLLGVACLLIASKYEDRYPPSITQLIYLTDYSFAHRDLCAMEIAVLKELSYQVFVPTPFHYVEWLLETAVAPSLKKKPYRAKLLMLSYYLLDLVAVDSMFSSIRPSIKAAAALFLSSALIAMIDSTASATGGKETSAPGLAVYVGNAFKNDSKVAKEEADGENHSGCVNWLSEKFFPDCDEKRANTNPVSSDVMYSSEFKAAMETMVRVVQCTEVELLDVVKKMTRSLADAEHSTYQGARTKFARENYLQISHDKTIISSVNLSRLAASL